MFRALLPFVLLVSMFFTAACNSGSSSSGGGASAAAPYAPKDMEGVWNYVESAQGGLSCSGTMTFSEKGQLNAMTNSCCSNQIVNAEFWIFQDGYVKGRNYAWCNEAHRDGNPMLKYSMNFKNAEKNQISGIVDLHYTDSDYTRFNITMTRKTPILPPPTFPGGDPNTVNGKRSVKTGGLGGQPAKR